LVATAVDARTMVYKPVGRAFALAGNARGGASRPQRSDPGCLPVWLVCWPARWALSSAARSAHSWPCSPAVQRGSLRRARKRRRRSAKGSATRAQWSLLVLRLRTRPRSCAELPPTHWRRSGGSRKTRTKPPGRWGQALALTPGDGYYTDCLKGVPKRE
jgi:hypothetical protein